MMFLGSPWQFRRFHFQFIDYLREKSLSIEIWGQQGDQAVTGGPAVNRHRKVTALNVAIIVVSCIYILHCKDVNDILTGCNLFISYNMYD